MTWVAIERHAHYRSACWRFRLYALPEGWVAIDFGPAPGVPQPIGFSPAGEIEQARTWAAERKREGRVA